MFNIRNGVFETNSSSTHSLIINNNTKNNYILIGNHLKIKWLDTDDIISISELDDKLSYLISQLANNLRWNCNTYEELLEEIESNHEYKEIKKYIKDKFNQEIRFPIYEDDLDYIVEINHQLVPDESYNLIESLLDELIKYNGDYYSENFERIDIKIQKLNFKDKLDIYFKYGNYIVIGSD